MRRVYFLLAFILLSFSLNSCTDIIEKSSSLVLVLPSNSRAALSSAQIEKYEISLYGGDSNLIEKKSALPGELVEFEELDEGVYSIKVLGFIGLSKVAFGEAAVEVHSGLTTEISVAMKWEPLVVTVTDSQDEYLISSDGTNLTVLTSLKADSYNWLVEGNPVSDYEWATVSADGKTLTVNTGSWTNGTCYEISVSSFVNGIVWSSTATVTK